MPVYARTYGTPQVKFKPTFHSRKGVVSGFETAKKRRQLFGEYKRDVVAIAKVTRLQIEKFLGSYLNILFCVIWEVRCVNFEGCNKDAVHLSKPVE